MEQGTRNRRRAGMEQESLAAAYLKRAGVQILERNYRTQKGEVDIIGEDGEYLVFFEVKWRSQNGSGYASEAVDRRKQRQICGVADYYLYENAIPQDQGIRFDVIAVDGEKIEWIKDAFSYTGRNF
ncbi:MAG: YraN family protein [Lachnospiraceae bacterium]|jgi:putative endonuclease|nr:YraN family protein [Lachnospiraceae bacterium]